MPPLASILLLSLLLLAPLARADWTYVGPAPAGGTTYVDLATRASVDGLGRVHFLADYTTPRRDPNGTTFRSSESTMEFDCAHRRVHGIERRIFAGARGSGSAMATAQPMPTWNEVPADSRGKAMLRLACEPVPLLDSPTLDWSQQPTLGDAGEFRYDPSKTHVDGSTSTMRLLIDATPSVASVTTPATKSIELDITLDCKTGTLASVIGLGHAEQLGRGAATLIETNWHVDPASADLPDFKTVATRNCRD